LFWDLYILCSWDDKEGPKHIKSALKEMILNFVEKAKDVG